MEKWQLAAMEAFRTAFVGIIDSPQLTILIGIGTFVVKQGGH